jgi:hypothetical protein
VNPTWPSKVTMAPSSRLFMVTFTTALLGITIGRLVRVCGQIGVNTIASTLGLTIGPPAESA